MKKEEEDYKKLLDTSIVNHRKENETKDDGIKVNKIVMNI